MCKHIGGFFELVACALSHVGSMYVVIYIMLFISNKGLILCLLLNFIPNNLASYCINYQIVAMQLFVVLYFLLARIVLYLVTWTLLNNYMCHQFTINYGLLNFMDKLFTISVSLNLITFVWLCGYTYVLAIQCYMNIIHAVKVYNECT